MFAGKYTEGKWTEKNRVGLLLCRFFLLSKMQCVCEMFFQSFRGHWCWAWLISSLLLASSSNSPMCALWDLFISRQVQKGDGGEGNSRVYPKPWLIIVLICYPDFQKLSHLEMRGGLHRLSFFFLFFWVHACRQKKKISAMELWKLSLLSWIWGQRRVNEEEKDLKRSVRAVE